MLTNTYTMDISKIIKYGMVTIVVTSAGIYVLKKVMDKAKYKKAKASWDHVGQDIVVLHLPLRPKTAGKYTLFRKKRFTINFFVRQNASKFAIFIEKENPCSFFRFLFRAFLSFTL